MFSKRFTLDGLCEALGRTIDSEANKPLPSIGAGVAKARASKSRYANFPAFCERSGLPKPTPEHRFHPVRLWRMDFAFPEHRVFVEIQGGLFTNGRHNRGAAMLKEFEKMNAASGMGYRPIYVQPCELYSSKTIESIRSAINYQHPKTT